MTFTEQIRQDQCALLSKASHLKQPQQRRAYLFENDPFTDKVKKRAWREMAKSLTANRPIQIDYSKLPPAEREWMERNKI